MKDGDVVSYLIRVDGTNDVLPQAESSLWCDAKTAVVRLNSAEEEERYDNVDDWESESVFLKKKKKKYNTDEQQ